MALARTPAQWGYVTNQHPTMSDAASIILSASDIEALTGDKIATKQLQVLHGRGFVRAYINRKSVVVVERTHYEAVTRGEVHNATKKTANLSFMRAD